MAKLKPGEKRVQLSFLRPDDVALFSFLEKEAYAKRYDVSTLIILELHHWFEGQFGTAATEITPSTPAPVEAPPPPPKPAPEPAASTDDGYEATKAAIAQNNALYLKKAKPKKGAIPGAP